MVLFYCCCFQGGGQSLLQELYNLHSVGEKIFIFIGGRRDESKGMHCRNRIILKRGERFALGIWQNRDMIATLGLPPEKKKLQNAGMGRKGQGGRFSAHLC